MLREEKLVAQLERLGVRYLSRQTNISAKRLHLPGKLLADLICQPSSRVRNALIALLLAQPGFAAYIPDALKRLAPDQVRVFKLLYTAAVILQRIHAARLKMFLGADWNWLTDWFSTELCLSDNTPERQLKELARMQQQWTGIYINWAGTYENSARQLLRRWEMEQK